MKKVFNFVNSKVKLTFSLLGLPNYYTPQNIDQPIGDWLLLAQYFAERKSANQIQH